ncbi:mechanosensitive ion channel family protein [Aridibaculum aurantiacum]|uniref:mechanosensitive ion channel family protein n=1 Tax=Aridibaculum aurantiacum TaxID=2810307 RepID=UPI001A95E3B7|nr:mechanosensitive ion channel family protein [Aridibaculum aurantiacum]
MWKQLIDQIDSLPPYALNLVLALAAILTGLIFKGIATIILRIYSRKNLDYSLFRSIISRLSTPITWFLPLLTLNIVLPLMVLNARQLKVLNNINGILLIVVFAYILIALVHIVQDYFYNIYDLRKEDNLRERRVRTQIQFIRKLLIGMIVIISIGAILLSFPSLRRVGAGLLTGVGVGGIIIGLAAQKTLGNLLAGLQIAFTQPIRIDDVVIVENEWGRIEEITLTYVVVNIWDQRRLVVPINHFIEKPFQNWTRTTSQILGTVFLYLDYTAPVDMIRAEFDRLVNKSHLWDRRVGVLQVTNTTDRTIELRVLVSAASAGNAFDLRCYLRENLVSFIQKNYPDSLPKTRAEISPEKQPAELVDLLK